MLPTFETGVQTDLPGFAVAVADLLNVYGLTLNEAERNFPGLTEMLDAALKEPA